MNLYLFSAQSLNRAHLCSFSCGINTKEQAYAAGEQKCNCDYADIDIRRNFNYGTSSKRARNTQNRAYNAAYKAEYNRFRKELKSYGFVWRQVIF